MASKPALTTRRAYEIGDAHGEIAVYLTRESAMGLLSIIPPDDMAWGELNDAVKLVYENEEDE